MNVNYGKQRTIKYVSNSGDNRVGCSDANKEVNFSALTIGVVLCCLEASGEKFADLRRITLMELILAQK